MTEVLRIVVGGSFSGAWVGGGSFAVDDVAPEAAQAEEGFVLVH